MFPSMDGRPTASKFKLRHYPISWAFGYSAKICIQNEKSNQFACEHYNLALAALLQIYKAIDAASIIITALATVAVAGFTFTLWSVTGRAVDLARDEFVANLRPWLFIEPTLASDLTFERQSGRVSINFKFRNTGNAPALNIMLNCHFITIEDRAPTLLNEIMAEQTRYYSALKRPSPMVIGHSLFPREDMLMPLNMSINQDEIERHTKGKKGAGFSLILVGSASYRSPVDDSIHHTGFIYRLRKPKPGEINLSLNFGSHDHVVLVDQMDLARSFQSGFAD